jgi:hypothetical protein
MSARFLIETGRELRANLVAEIAKLLNQVTVAQTAAAESALAAQVYRNRIRNADNYLMTVPDETPIEELRRDLRALLAGGMN